LRELTQSLSRFSWVMSLFGFKQLANLMSAGGGADGDPANDPSAAFETVGNTAQTCLGETFLKIFQSGDRMLRTTVDTLFGWQPDSNWLSPGDPSLDESWSPMSTAQDPWGEPRPDAMSWDSDQSNPIWHSAEQPSSARDSSEAWIGGWGPMPQPSAQPATRTDDHGMAMAEEAPGDGAWGPMPSMDFDDHHQHAPEASSGMEELSPSEAEHLAAMHAMSGAWPDGTPADGGSMGGQSVVGGWGPMPPIPTEHGARS